MHEGRVSSQALAPLGSSNLLTLLQRSGSAGSVWAGEDGLAWQCGVAALRPAPLQQPARVEIDVRKASCAQGG